VTGRIKLKVKHPQTVLAASLVIASAIFLGSFAIAQNSPAALSAATAPPSIHFDDVTRAAGIHFTRNSGAFGKKWLPETVGSGVAFLDYDNDGWQDILLVNGTDFPGHGSQHTTLAL
jgi:enediyne biosynthesis protein E4